jgi:nucleoside-diphosphate-sugar epimerase
MKGEKILVTGATGKIAFPIARALAADNEVWGAARLRDPAERERLVQAGIRPAPLDISTGDVSSLPDDFTYVFHAAVDPGKDDWTACEATNAQRSGDLLHHCRRAKGIVFCSTGSIYGYQGTKPLKETDAPGVPLRANYSFSKVAAESVCTWVATRYNIPLTIIRVCSTYGPLGGTAADRFEAILQRKPIRLHPEQPNDYHPIYEDDYVALGIRAMEVAATPPMVVNWGGSEAVSVEDYCTYMGGLVGIEPIFEFTPEAHTPLRVDVTRMHEVLGSTKVPWRDGMRRMIRARHPGLRLKDE